MRFVLCILAVLFIVGYADTVECYILNAETIYSVETVNDFEIKYGGRTDYASIVYLDTRFVTAEMQETSATQIPVAAPESSTQTQNHQIFSVIVVVLTFMIIVALYFKFSPKQKLKKLTKLSKNITDMDSVKRDKLLADLLKKHIKKFDKDKLSIISIDKNTINASAVFFMVASRNRLKDSNPGKAMPAGYSLTHEAYNKTPYKVPDFDQIWNSGYSSGRIILADSVRQINCDKEMYCSVCGGNGRCTSCRNGKVECRRCFGKGFTLEQREAADGSSKLTEIRCTDCNGSGEFNCDICGGRDICQHCDGRGKVVCNKCDGTGIISEFEYIVDSYYKITLSPCMHDNYEYPKKILGNLNFSAPNGLINIDLKELLEKERSKSLSILEQAIYGKYISENNPNNMVTIVKIARQELLGEIFMVELSYEQKEGYLFFSDNNYEFLFKGDS